MNTTATGADPTPSRDYFAFQAGMEAAFASMNPPPCFELRDDVIERAFHQNQAKFDASRLYYEAHITIEPKPGMAFDDFRRGFQNDLWRVSAFAEDDVDQIVGKWFITSRAKSHSHMVRMVRTMCQGLRANGFQVLRAKIEDTLLDTKHGDEL